MGILHKEWFKSWFDSPYYHILYKDRDEQEAQDFLDHLISFLKPPPDSKILDVACGKGRHSVYLNKKGFHVTGFDLSQESIDFDRQFENTSLSFYVHDMREMFRVNDFNYVFNLFSSFGYFDDQKDNENVIRAHAAALVPDGILVIDYMNSKKVASSLILEDEKRVGAICFRQKRKISSGRIVKKISFSDCGKDFTYEEHLQLYGLKDFEKLFSENQLVIKHIFGDYSLNKFDETTSDRLILIAEKKA